MFDVALTLIHNEEIAPRCFRMGLSGLPDDFHILPGQFVMLKVGTEYDPLLRRPFAAFRVERREGPLLEIYYQVVGRATALMAGLASGASLKVLGPLGNGFSVPPGIQTALLVAGGMGIVPIRNLVHQARHDGTLTLHLFFGAQSAASLLFLHEFSQLNIVTHLSTEDGTLGHRGLVTELLQDFLDHKGGGVPERSSCFACGPWHMLQAVARLTAQENIGCQVALESRMACGIGACLGCVVKRKNLPASTGAAVEYSRVCREGPVFDAQEIAW